MRKLIILLALLFFYAGIAFASHNPKIEITPDSWDFGRVTETKVLTHKFKVKNMGDDILEIKHITTSCDCVTASMFLKKVYPGEAAELTVKLDLRKEKTQGKIKRDVYIESNDPEQRFKTVSVYVELDTGKKSEETPNKPNKVTTTEEAHSPPK
ncbi:MAG: DUF1573 domain-containing protein [Candidatus Omnitrophota bacterium]